MEIAVKDTLELQGATSGAEKVNKKMRKLTDKKSAINAARQIMLLMIAISRTQSATIGHIYCKCKQRNAEKEA